MVLAPAWAYALAAYCAAIVALGALRVCAEGWFGLPIREPDDRRLFEIVVLHLVLAVVLVVIGRFLQRRAGSHQRALRLLAAATPLLLLVSADRICAYFVPPCFGTDKLFVADRELGWRNRPGGEGEWGWCHVKINNQGFRGPELPLEKAPGEFRILFLGDSLAYGWRVDYDYCFVARVQALLADRMPDRRVTTVACAVTGYSSWQEVILLEREGLKYHPDLVVHCFCLNDLTAVPQLRRFGGDREGLEEVLLAAARWEWSGLYRLSLLARHQRSRGAAQDDAQMPWFAPRVNELLANPDSPDSQKAWRLTRDDLCKIDGLCRERGIPLMIVCFPFAQQLPPGASEPWPQERLGKLCDERRIPYLDLLPAERAWDREKEPEQVLWVDECHPSVAGHALVAQEIVRFLGDRGLAPPGKPGPAGKSGPPAGQSRRD